MNPIRLAKRVKNRMVGVKPVRPVEVQCPRVYLGSRYGGWHVHGDSVGPESVVYAAGVGEDTSFDEAVISQIGCTVHAFDPTPRAIAYVDRKRSEGGLDDRFRLYPWAIAPEDGRATFHLPRNTEHVSASLHESGMTGTEAIEVECRSLASIMAELGHERIDVLKLDIEGAEYEVLEELAGGAVRPGQILFETHDGMFSDGRAKSERMLKKLGDAGYRVFAVDHYGREYSMIHDSVV